MIEDARRLDPAATLETDIAIVGAGAAGITLALELSRRTPKSRILLIEGGGDRFDYGEQSRFFAGEEVTHPHHPPLDLYRRRMLGGTTSVWGGRCIPMDESDFSPRRDLGRDGWPVSFGEVSRHYSRALEILEAGKNEFTARAALPHESADMAPVSAGTGLVLDRLERFSPPTDLGVRYRQELSRAANMTVLLHATCREILTNDTGTRTTGLSLIAGGKRLTVRAGTVVVAAGGLETPRLLLNSRKAVKSGLGNRSGQLGRNYMTHYVGDLGRIAFAHAPGELNIDYSKSRDGVWCRRLMLLDERTRRDNGLPNFVLRPSIPAIHDPAHGSAVLSAAFFAKRFLIPEYARRLASMPQGERVSRWPLAAHARNLVAGAPGLAGFAASWTRRRILPRRKIPSLFLRSKSGGYPLEFNVEEVANPRSRVMLSSDCDPNGMPRLKVSWGVPANVPEQILRIYEVFAREAQAAGLGEVPVSESEKEQVRERCYAQGGHHMGTARMSSVPVRGVVGPDLQVWGTDGLYVLGASVFPSCGFANPTLTIVALALRLAETLASGYRVSRPGEAPAELTPAE